MSFIVFQDSGQVDVSLMIVSNTPVVRKSISMDLESPFATMEFSCEIHDGFFLEGEQRFRPLAGQRIQWFSDDSDAEKLFDGFIVDAPSVYVGRDTEGNAILKYSISAKDPSWLLEHKKISGKFENILCGTVIDQLVAVADPRLTPAGDNDVGMTVSIIELSEMSYKEAVEAFAKASGLMVWIDENWNVHHKQYSTIMGLANDSKFNITDTNKLYSKLNMNETIDEVVTRVHIQGGKTGEVDREKGEQEQKSDLYTKTASLEDVNRIRTRLGFTAFAVGTDPETITVDEPGIIEKIINAQENQTLEDLELIADAVLEMYSKPLLVGSVVFKPKGLVHGKSIVINSSSRQINTVVPVIELEISSSDSGFDEDGNKIYTYTANFNGPSMITKIKKKLEGKRGKNLLSSKLIKPGTPNTITIQSQEIVSSYGVAGVIVRK